MSNINQYLWTSKNKTYHPDSSDLTSAYYCRNRRVWEILQLWYRDAYEETQNKNNLLCTAVNRLKQSEIRLKRSNFSLRRSSRIQQRTIQILREENRVLHDVFARMHAEYPREFSNLVRDIPFFQTVDEVSGTDQEVVQRELDFETTESDSDF